MLEWPGRDVSFKLKEVVPSRLAGKVGKVTLLSVKRNYSCPFTQYDDGLEVTIPHDGRRPSDAAGVIKIETEQ